MTEADYLAYVDASFATALEREVRDDGLKMIAGAFASNIRALHLLALLPQYLLTYAAVRIERARQPDSNVVQAQKAAVSYMRELASDEQMSDCLEATRRAVLVDTWGAFDCLSNDTLELVCPPAKPPRGLKTIGDAFRKTFPTRDRELREIFERNDLVELSELRHVILHRGGVVDEAYKAKVSWTTDVLGARVALPGTRVKTLASSCIAAARELLLLVQDERSP